MSLKTFLFNSLYNYRKNSIPKALKRNQKKLNSAELQILENSIRQNYHKGWRSEDNYTPETYAQDLQNHLTFRLEQDRTLYVPWLNKSVKLNGCRILEIGCGTGASTVALAEQGAQVIGIDIDEDSIQVAKDRCAIHNVDAQFISGNATALKDQLSHKKFDLIIFYACLEHMTYSERIESLKLYYNLLPKGAFLSIVDTPNRLWFYDDHTALLPAYNWLPDRLAYDYAKFSSRPNFSELYNDYTDEQFLHFLRNGRGFSFHELEIALDKKITELDTISYLKPTVIPFTKKYKFHKFLITMFPDVNSGYLHAYLDVLIKK